MKRCHHGTTRSMPSHTHNLVHHLQSIQQLGRTQMTATKIKKGDWYKWDRLNITVTRVSKTGEWANILVEDPGNTTWTKRQPLPLPETFKPMTAIIPRHPPNLKLRWRIRFMLDHVLWVIINIHEYRIAHKSRVKEW